MSLHIPNGEPGGITLPAIPEDVLAQYPYTIIIHGSYGDNYAVMACDSAFYYATKEVSGITYADGVLVGQSGIGVVYACSAGATEWTRDEENNEVFSPIGELVMGGTAYGVYTLVWANHDICIATAFTSPTDVTIGTEVYFSERQNFNGVWLPKIPNGFETSYPYVLILDTKVTYTDYAKQLGFSDYELYTLIMSPNQCAYAENLNTGNNFLGCAGYYSYSAESIGGEWGYINEDLELSSNNVTNEVMDEVGSAEFNIIYSNHDIMNANIDTDGNIIILDTVYITGSGVAVPSDMFAVDHDSMVFSARIARSLSNSPMTPLSFEQSMQIFENIETYEDAEGMVF